MTTPTSPDTRALEDVALAPCPFCGKAAEIERDSDHHGSWFNLGCSNHWGKRNDGKHCIGARMFYTEGERSEAECIALWNARASITQPPALTDRRTPGTIEVCPKCWRMPGSRDACIERDGETMFHNSCPIRSHEKETK